MHAEREVMVKRVFPRLRKLCEERRVTWGEVDLRWGIPDEEAAEGHVLGICLAEIENCRPYFVGLVGDRYGWVPDRFPPEVVEEHPWLRDFVGASVTEIEMVHGALNHLGADPKPLFYFRAPAYVVDTLPSDSSAEFREEPRVARLEALKARIRSAGLVVRPDYENPERLGEYLLADLTGIIERAFPIEEVPDALTAARAAHSVFAASRHDVYISRPEHFRRLAEHVQGSDPPLTVLGASGVGKSALLANWTESWRSSDPSDGLITHFIGALPESSDWASMLRRIMAEIARHYALDNTPVRRDALAGAFERLLFAVPDANRLVLVIDGLNLLDDRDGALDLVWLPGVIPPHVRIVLSTLPGSPLDEIHRRGWPTMTVTELEVDERMRLIDAYLGRWRKSLGPHHVTRISRAPRTGLPLYLRALLEELRVWGEHASLDERIEHYLAAETPVELFRRILARYEADYDPEGTRLVGRAMTHLWAARHGLSEAELLDLLGPGDEPLPAARWSPLHLAMQQSLVSRGGLITFFHDHLRDAVREAYLPADLDVRAAHRQLATYFGDREATPRKIEEWPWQLARAGEWRPLETALTDLGFLDRLWKEHQQDALEYWQQIETHSAGRLVDAYAFVLNDPITHATKLWPVGRLMMETGHLVPAAEVWRAATTLAEHADDHDSVKGALNNLGITLFVLGDLDGAERCYDRVKRICEATGDLYGLQTVAGNLGNVCRERGDLDAAIELYRIQEDICRRLGLRQDLQSAIGNQAAVLLDRNELESGLERLDEQLRLAREVADKRSVHVALANRATTLMLLGDDAEAARLAQTAEQYFRSVGNKENLWGALSIQAVLLAKTGEFDRAQPLYEEAERVCAAVGNLKELARFHYRAGCALLASYASRGRRSDRVYTFEQFERHVEVQGRIFSHGYPRLAADAFRRAVALDAGFAEAHRQLGVALERCNDRQGAAAAYERALQLQPDWPDVQIRLASILMEVDDAGT